MMFIEVLKEGINKSFKEICANTNRQWNEMIKVQDLRTEIDSVRKTQTGGNIEVTL